MNQELPSESPKSKTKKVNLRAFEIKNPNISESSSNARAMLASKLSEVKMAKDRCMLLNLEDPNRERDLISYFKEASNSNSVFLHNVKN